VKETRFKEEQENFRSKENRIVGENKGRRTKRRKMKQRKTVKRKEETVEEGGITRETREGWSLLTVLKLRRGLKKYK
jgi:hypothetical protein